MDLSSRSVRTVMVAAGGEGELSGAARDAVALARTCGADDAAVVRLGDAGPAVVARAPGRGVELPEPVVQALRALAPGAPAAGAGGWVAAPVVDHGRLWGAVCAAGAAVARGTLEAVTARLAGLVASHLAAARASRSTEQDLDLILDAIAEGVYGVDNEGRATFINRAGAEMLGWPADEFIGCRTHQAVHHSRADGTPYPEEECDMVAAVREGRAGYSEDDVFWRRDGTSFPVAYSTTPMVRDGRVVGAVVSFRDITLRARADQRLRDSEERFRTLTLHAPVGILQADTAGEYTFVSERWCELTGLGEAEGLGAGWTRAIHPADRQWVLADWREAVALHAPTSSEHRLVTTDGTEHWVLFDAVPLRDDDGRVQGFIGTITDVTSRRRAEEQARTDALTGLANRRAFMEALEDEIQRVRRAGGSLALVMLDLDHFKEVNDGHGHAVGDRVLVDTARRLRAVARDDDTLARIGGEEFAWLLPSADMTAARGAAERARRAVRAEPFDQVGHVTISLGVADADGRLADGEDLVRRADRALYRAKRAGRDAVEE